MQIAVTGSSGFIGAEITRVLLERGHTVHGTESPSFDLVVINPVGVIGPSVTSGVNTTSRVIMDLLNGGVYPAIIDMAFPLVDVRDVAEAHVRAAESPDASGRYICTA